MRQLFLKQRDYEILADLENLRLMTIKQIHELYFTSKSYCYERMKKLESMDYVTSRPYVASNGQKIGVCYYLTNKGFKLLEIDSSKNALDLIEPRLHKYRVSLSEIYVQLSKHGWIWLNSRKAKDAYGLNRNRKLGGILRRPNQDADLGYEDIGVYLLTDIPRENTIRKIKSELYHHHMLRKFIILHFQETHLLKYKSGEELREWDYKEREEEKRFTLNLSMMNFDYGLKFLKYLSDTDYILKPPFANNKDFNFIRHESMLFSSHFAEYKDHPCYLVDLMVPNFSTIYHLEKYGQDRALAENKGVLAFVSPDELDMWNSRFNKTHKHIYFLPVKI